MIIQLQTMIRLKPEQQQEQVEFYQFTLLLLPALTHCDTDIDKEQENGIINASFSKS